MKSNGVSLSLLASLSVAAAADLPSIVVKGNKFFYPNGTQFFMKGVAYQQEFGAAGTGTTSTGSNSYIDPLANKANCERDVPLLKELGTNTIRTYAIDPTANHDACMKLLQDAGIYVVADLSEPKLSINREEPKWTTDLLERYQKVVDSMSKYSNVIGYFAGNEVTNSKNNTAASAFVKAAVRDTKRYIKEKHNSRWIGVGYASNDDEDIRTDITNYFNCDKTEDSADYWGYNIYSWCGDKSSMKISGYDKQVEFFSNYSIPVFFAEYGCNDPGGAEARVFEDTEALYSSAMTGVFSGGIVYMYFQEANDYGLVQIKDGKAVKMKNFEALKKKMAKANPQGTTSSAKEAKLAECPSLAPNWKASKTLPPQPNKAMCDCMVRSRSCVPKSSLQQKSFGSVFDFICSKNTDLCVGISANATSGIYGAYSMCEDSAKLAFVMDAYYQKQNSAASSCDFDGAANTQKAANEDSCAALLKSAKEINDNAAAGKPTQSDSTKKDSGAIGMAVGAPAAWIAAVLALVALSA